MATLAQVAFEIPNVKMPKRFTGFLCVLFAGEKFHSGCDVNSDEDAYWDAVRSARLSMIDACAVDKSVDPAAHVGSVLMFFVQDGAAVGPLEFQG